MGWGENGHVARHHDDLELPSQIQGRQVLLHPDQLWRQPARLPQHRCVAIDPDHIDASPGQLDRHPAGAAACVQHRPGQKGLNEVGLAVHALSTGGEGIETGLVGSPVEAERR
ncbi:MAG TPA: hypothetical protein VE990_10245 [Acidimicrobiales bacterium]|nr:hypothetical protein [Acidimicrobiales bacterium]